MAQIYLLVYVIKIGEHLSPNTEVNVMKFVRYGASAIVFLIACPLSWFAAWDASSSILATAFSVALPTWGLMFWGLVNIFGHGFGIGAGSFVLGMGGAFVSLLLIQALNSEK